MRRNIKWLRLQFNETIFYKAAQTLFVRLLCHCYLIRAIVSLSVYQTIDILFNAVLSEKCLNPPKRLTETFIKWLAYKFLNNQKCITSAYFNGTTKGGLFSSIFVYILIINLVFKTLLKTS